MPSERFVLAQLVSTCIFLLAVHTANGSFSRNVLWHSLTNDLMKDLPPEGADGYPVAVEHSINIQRVMDLEDDILILKLWEYLKWQDLRLAWNPGMYDGIEKLTVPSRTIWQPDILLYNSAEEYSGFATGDLNAVVYANGTVNLVPSKVTKSFCYVNESLLDEGLEISCNLKFGSWTQSNNTLDLRLSHDVPEVRYMNRAWQVVNTTAEKHEKSYPCCPEDVYMYLEYTINLKRQ